MSQHVTKVFTDGNFEAEVLQAKEPVLVDFWASWCGPCKMLAPTIEALASEYEGKVKVGKLSTEENMKVPAELGVQAIPTVVLFKGGKEVDRVVGAVPKDQLVKLLEKGF
jgi:thioredoxin 1